MRDRQADRHLLLLLWPTLALWIAAEGWPPLYILAIFIAGTFLMRSAGCVHQRLRRSRLRRPRRAHLQPPCSRLAWSPGEALALAAVLSAPFSSSCCRSIPYHPAPVPRCCGQLSLHQRFFAILPHSVSFSASVSRWFRRGHRHGAGDRLADAARQHLLWRWPTTPSTL